LAADETREEHSMTQKNTEPEDLGQTPGSGEEQDADLAEDQRGNIRLYFERGGAVEREELKRHLAQVCAALCRARYYDTLAVFLRGLGSDDDQILENIKDDQVARGLPVGSAWNALKTAGIRPDSGAMVAALREVDNSYRRRCETVEQDVEDIPF
jgi:hypothetical protein